MEMVPVLAVSLYVYVFGFTHRYLGSVERGSLSELLHCFGILVLLNNT